MKVLVTGANGFIGKNLVSELINRKFEVYSCDIETSKEELDYYCENCDFVFHLAGINRPLHSKEFMTGNFNFTIVLLNSLEHNRNKCPVLMSSSTQAELDNDYGKSKRAGEDYLKNYALKNGVSSLIFRLPNVYGKWCRPNYNSVIATFCNNISRDLEITVSNSKNVLNLVYIDDVVNTFIDAIYQKCVYHNREYNTIRVQDNVELGKIVELLKLFKESRKTLSIPNMKNEFEKKLYSTYLSYIPEEDFSYELKMNIDGRGSFTEFIRSEERGQVSINISKPHIVKGNHWHHSKSEKFLIVYGKGIIRLRKIGTKNVIILQINSDKLHAVDIPCGYTHSIENIGEEDMVTVMWVNEPFDPQNPDTFYEEV